MTFRRILVGCALAAFSAVLLTLSFPPYGLWWLIAIALLPMIIAHERVLPAKWAALAPSVAIGGFLLGYLGGVFPERAAWYMKALPLLVAVAVFAGARGDRERRDRTGYAWWPLASAASWVAIDLVRSVIPFLATWGFFGNALFRQSWVLQPVRFVGVFGLDLLIGLVNYAIAMVAIACIDRRMRAPVAVTYRLAGRWFVGVLAVVAVWCAASVLLRAPREAPTLRVAALQPGIRPRQLAMPRAERDRVMLERLSAQTREAAARGARVIVWPEGALAADPAVAYSRELADLARETHAYLVVGYGIWSTAGSRKEVITVEPSGTFAGRFGKDHPVGFLGESSISRGTYPTIQTPFGRMGSIICYDMDFTDTARRIARQGANVIAVPSADWREIATSHYIFAVFRALETGAAIVKAEYSFDSAIVDGYGRILASAVTPEGSSAVLVADVPLRSGVPLAIRLGDWVGWACVVALVLRALIRLRSRWRSESHGVQASDRPGTSA